LKLHHWIKQQSQSTDIDTLVRMCQKWLSEKSDNELIETIMTGFIPDKYENNKSEEKVFAKLMEVVIAEWGTRLGFHTVLQKTKSEKEDVSFIFNNQAILTDVKTFRLGRSQKAPNVKDFVKSSSVQKWIDTFNQQQQETAIGGFIVYPSTHEWTNKSAVYQDCSNLSIPIVMLPFEVLSYFLQEKALLSPDKILSLWNYSCLFPKTIKTKEEYWKVMIEAISQILDKPIHLITNDLEKLKEFYRLSVRDAINVLSELQESNEAKIRENIERLSIEDMKELIVTLLIDKENQRIAELQESIRKHRSEYLF
jgi:HindIII restriction endonuclease